MKGMRKKHEDSMEREKNAHADHNRSRMMKSYHANKQMPTPEMGIEASKMPKKRRR